MFKNDLILMCVFLSNPQESRTFLFWTLYENPPKILTFYDYKMKKKVVNHVNKHEVLPESADLRLPLSYIS